MTKISFLSYLLTYIFSKLCSKIQSTQVILLYARFLCSRAHSAKRAREDMVSCIQVILPFNEKTIFLINNGIQIKTQL